MIFSLFIAAAVSLVTTGSNIGLQEEQGTQAFFIAEGGLESAILQFKKGAACNALSSGSLGAGSFAITGTNYTTATTLSSGIANTDTVIPVVSTAGFAAHGRIRIDAESIIYSATSSVAANCAPFSAPCFTGAIRGTGAVGHTGSTRVSQDECLIRSTGTITSALTSIQRVVEKSLQNPGAMVVYAKLNGDGTPYFRLWDGAEWGPERTATPVPANIQYIILKFASTRNEAILGTLSSNGDIRVQVWNGSTWSATTLLVNVGTTDANYRGFDIEYETNRDRAIVVYNDGTADPDYRIWDGANWSIAGNINIPTTGSPNWIELARNPLASSNEIAMIVLDSNADVYGMRWTGAGWDNMGAAGVWDTEATSSTTKAIHVGYEQLSGRAMFVWGTRTSPLFTQNRYIGYRIWNGTSLSAATNQRIANIGNHTVRWLRFASDPYSNNIMLGIQDSGSDLITSLWNSTAWDANGTQHDNSLEDSSRNFDLVYETAVVNAGRIWLLWGNGSLLSRRQWTGAAWGGITTTGDDTSFVQLAAHPRFGVVFSNMYESSTSGTRDIWESHLTSGGTIWSAKFTLWGGPTIGAPVMERVSTAIERYVPVIKWKENY
ncbi:MAG: hypothetical protein LLF28_07355 [Nitrospiraceae bacterium]|nr:hypothetical protein [Nitrospiraceae bacterium]